VRIEEKCWCSLLLLFVICPPALSQAVTVASDGANGPANVSWIMEQETVAPLQLAADGQAPSPPPRTSDKPAQKPYGWHIAIYPALGWAPIFGTSVTLPPLPGQPIGTPGPSGSTSSSFNGAFFGGGAIRKG
jgi:hypothetical protein